MQKINPDSWGDQYASEINGIIAHNFDFSAKIHNLFCNKLVCVCVSAHHYSVYNGLVGFASPLVTDRDSECASPVSATQTSFAAGTDLLLIYIIFPYLCLYSLKVVAETMQLTCWLIKTDVLLWSILLLSSIHSLRIYYYFI